MSTPTLPVTRALRPAFARLRFLRSVWRRWFLWVLLAMLVLALLVTVVWLAGRHEVEQTQTALDRDTADAVSDLRSGLQRNSQTLRASLAAGADIELWETNAAALLREHREWLRLEWLDPSMRLVAAVDTPYRRHIFDDFRRAESQADVALACVTARKLGAPAFSPSHYVPIAQGSGLEVMEMCLPVEGGGYLVASYSLRDTLTELVAPMLSRGQEVAFTEIDGTRLAAIGAQRRVGTRVFTAQQLIDLPGAPVMLRVDGWRGVPDLFPNVLTALVTAISIALVSVLVLLARDTRRRLRAEHDLADALAFRKAMEDSVITGLRARDLQGRITYVNPAFCEMVGFTAEELMNSDREAPYWPTELAHEYQRRQAVRMAGAVPPREGFESVFMRKDGTRFPVLIFEAPLINAQGSQTGWMSAFIDISEQRRIEELSRASQERLQASARLATVGEMASLLSHELTQPLAAIASYATGSLNLLHAEGQPRGHDLDDVTMAVRRIAEQADRAGQVIRSVHDFVRRRDRTREAVAPQALIDAVLPLVRLQARKLDVQVELLFDDRLPPVYCDRTLVEQVLLNLARNGMQAMDLPELTERVLRIQVVRAGGFGRAVEPGSGADARRWLEFSVADVGPGISDEVAARLFTPFFTTRSDGMGLGLSLCRTVVEQHGGVMIFEPQAPCGTVFRFTLPVK
ncbi:MAG: PAS domain S-box protein [Variovorax sp.]|nr:PAS domain S-box protein [Variovorax sp.]